MRIPIAHCLGWPERSARELPRLNLAEIGSLTFEAPDPERFPALRLARTAMEAGGALPTVLNAANEVAVEAFLQRRLGFTGIPAVVERVLERAAAERLAAPETVNAATAIDHVTRLRTRDLLLEFAAKAS
jgi:1-deoxy-D-xylulose-5-phosphate reductoisomerase